VEVVLGRSESVGSEPNECRYLGLSARGFHRLVYWEWGSPGHARVLLCVHGLTRQGRDFDRLAAALAPNYHVAAPDIVGRGQSDWLADKAGYGYPQYCADMAALIARLGSETVDWVGTSMGGLIGMILAAQPNAPIRHLVLNDIGPLVPKAGVERLAAYVGKDPRFPSLDAAIAYMREVAAPFGALSEAEWRHLTVHGLRGESDGSFRLRYDPAIAAPLQGEIKDVDLWSLWDRITCPVLVLRGERSDLLLPATAAEMQRRGPKAKVVDIPGCGHAPALMAAEQIAHVREFLLG
jgi:pimeloyl-ACP methyl ester carboxylesterase